MMEVEEAPTVQPSPAAERMRRSPHLENTRGDQFGSRAKGAHANADPPAGRPSGNGFRAVGVIQALEVDLGRPVLTANQVAFWHALRLSGSRLPIANYGRIFDHEML
jgi:hypothetical protein